MTDELALVREIEQLKLEAVDHQKIIEDIRADRIRLRTEIELHKATVAGMAIRMSDAESEHAKCAFDAGVRLGEMIMEAGRMKPIIAAAGDFYDDYKRSELLTATTSHLRLWDAVDATRKEGDVIDALAVAARALLNSTGLSDHHPAIKRDRDLLRDALRDVLDARKGASNG